MGWLAEWLNRIGMILVFLSFWFAAPEILGEDRLAAYERRFEGELIEFVTSWKLILSTFLVMTVVLFFLSLSMRSSPSSKGIIALIDTLILELVTGARRYLPDPFIDYMLWTYANKTNYLIANVLILLIGWLIAILGSVVTVKVSAKLLPILRDDSNLRRRYLNIGIIFFILGSLLQFLSTFM